MTRFRIVVAADIDELTATRIARLIKAALEPWAVETYTFTESQFQAHWTPTPSLAQLRAATSQHGGA